MINLKRICYSAVLRPSHQASDHETPTMVVVTEEINGWAMFLHSAEEGTVLKEFDLTSRDRVIERAVKLHLACQQDEKTVDKLFAGPRRPARMKAGAA
jgi:hypothetical protein